MSKSEFFEGLSVPRNRELMRVYRELQNKLGLSDRKSSISNYLEPAMESGVIEYTIPEKPNSSNQKYRLTQQGKAYKKKLSK